MVQRRRSRVAGAKRRVSPRQSATPSDSMAEPIADDELTAMVIKACLIARDAVFNVRDYLATSSQMAFLAIKDCEKELDQIERKIDEQLPGAITRVGEAKARQLLACLKFITDLERIGDLAYSAVMQLRNRHEDLPALDQRQLTEMTTRLCTMLEQVHQGFLERDVVRAREILQSDPEVDRVCHALFRRHLAETSPANPQDFEILLTAQALERIGDHAKNLAEELYGLVERRSLRHSARKLSTA